MRQLYCAGGPAGLEVRAATPGCPPEQVQAALACTAYARPAEPRPGAEPPVRLALVQTADAGRVLAHCAPADDGGYFAHVLLDVPAGLDAQHAAQAWGSPLWQRSDHGGGRDLPEQFYPPVADALSDAALRAWLGTPARRDLLEFVLTALLSGPGRVVLAADAGDVAFAAYAVTRALPAALTADFTFSTYEADPLASPARLVGHDPGAAGELPAACYTGGAAFNTFTDRRSEPGRELPFAAFAVKSLAAGDPAPLDEFRATWQRLGLKDASQFDLVDRLARGTGELTKDESAQALQNPALAAWVAGRSDALKQFLEWALEDRAFASTAFAQAAMALRQKPETLAKLSQTVQEEGLAAVQRGDCDRAAVALEVILPMAAPARAHAVWGDLLSRVSDPDKLSWEMRWYLLPRLVRFKPPAAGALDPALGPWLRVPAEQLADLLALDLPKPAGLTAARACLERDGEPTATLARAAAAHPALAMALLQPTGAPDLNGREAKLFDLLLAEAPQHAWADDVVRRGGFYPPLLLNRYAVAALDAGKTDAIRLVREQGPALLTHLAGRSGLDLVAERFLHEPPADLIEDRGLLEFLAKLCDQPDLGDEVRTRAEAARVLRRWLDEPALTAEALGPVADALKLEPPVVPPAVRQQVLRQVVGRLTAAAESPGMQADLETALVHLGPVLADGPAGLYRDLFRAQSAPRSFWRQPNLVHGYLAVALGATQAPELAGQLDGLEGDAFATAAQAARVGGRRVLAAVDARTADWPKGAKAQWGFLSKAVQPRGARGVGRDAALFLAGAGVALLTVWVVRLVQGW